MTFLLKTFFKLPKAFLSVDLTQVPRLQLQSFKTTSIVFSNQDSIAKHPDEALKPIKKRKESIKITLLQKENMTVTALEDAKNFAKRRSMHLVKIQDMDPKTQRPIFKLLTAAEMLENELSDAKQSNTSKSSAGAHKKTEKSISIGSRIGEHDLASRLKNISKWLNKQHEVRILIQATSEQDLVNAEKIFKTIEESIKSPEVIGRVVQKRTKGNLIKFNILPITPIAQQKAADNSQ